MKPTPKLRVARCVPRHDGGYLIVPIKGESAVSPIPIEIGSAIRIDHGRAVAV